MSILCYLSKKISLSKKEKKKPEQLNNRAGGRSHPLIPNPNFVSVEHPLLSLSVMHTLWEEIKVLEITVSNGQKGKRTFLFNCCSFLFDADTYNIVTATTVFVGYTGHPWGDAEPIIQCLIKL